MELAKAVEHIGTVLELRRIARAYVIDYKNLTDGEIRAAIVKTSPQYYFPNNVEKSLSECFLNPSRDVRVISHLFLKEVLLNKDGFMASDREVEDEIISWEQSVVDQSNEDLFKRDDEKSKNIALLRFVLETAWQNNDQISPDEKNLIDKIKTRLKITDREFCIVESKIGKFPKPGNQLHTRGEIDEVRQFLQSKGLVFSIRDNEGTDFDLIPDEVAEPLRAVLGVEIRKHGYRELLGHKRIRSKSYFVETLEKCGVPVEGQHSLEELQEMILEHVPPSKLIGGLSPKDGLSMETLAKWCDDLDLNVSGSKSERIERIISFYDNLLQHAGGEIVEDPRELWYQHYQAFASRNLEFLRSQMLIEKDNEVERKFEEATNYLFEHRLGVKPLTQIGAEHADGALSFRDELIYWDNKSKETQVNLKDHLRQFDQYIKSADKKVACFLVIGPDFTQDSSTVAMQYRVENGVTLTLITAEELKSLAEEWNSRDPKTADKPFPLGYLIQPARFNRSLVAPL
jgi:hypothetical protein